MATMDVYKKEAMFDKATQIANYWQDGLHSLKDLPCVIDIRNYGLLGAVDIEPSKEGVGKRGFDIYNESYFNQDLMFKLSVDTVTLSPPLIIEKKHIDELVDKLARAIKNVCN